MLYACVSDSGSHSVFQCLLIVVRTWVRFHRLPKNIPKMASSGSASVKDVEDVLKTYVERSATDGMLKLTPVMKCFEAAKLTAYKNALESAAWMKSQSAAKKVAPNVVATKVINDVATIFIARKKGIKDLTTVPEADKAPIIEEINNAIAGLKGVKKAAPKVDAATKRLTDVSGYTGSHKERFAADGTGLGAEGRKDMVDGSGYVGNYKGAGTYGKK